jgi:peptide/nickel transport system substrate-binding protein
MKNKIVWLIVTGLMVTTLVLVSCGPAATTTPPTTAPPTTAPPTTAPTTKPPITEPQYGGTITALQLVAGIEPAAWDPQVCDWRNNVFLGPYMENLLMGDLSKGPRGTNQFDFAEVQYLPSEVIKGCIAESWEIGSDLKSLTFHIRKGIMWQNKPGVMNARELTAADVAYTFNRLFAGVNAPPFYYYCDSASAPDKYTLVIKLKEYSDIWWQYIGYGWYCMIYPPELVTAGITNWRNAVGTGPWILKDYVSGSSVTYERNPNYWGTTTIGGKEYKIPFADKLVWPIISDTSTQLAALRTGKVDQQMVVTWIYKDTLAQTNPELMIWKRLATSNSAIALKVDKKPFDDIRVRQALSMAIDRESYVKAQLGGEGVIMSSHLSPRWSTDIYTPLEQLPASAKQLFDYNPEKAKQLLKDAGYPDGFKAEFVTMSYAAYVDLCSMVADYWKKIGVEVTLRPLDYATYMGVQYGKTYKDIMYYSTGYRHPALLLREIGTLPQVWNPTNFNDPYYNQLAMKAVGTADPVAQKPLLKELNVYLIDKAPYLVLPVGYIYTYAHPWVKNYFGEMSTGCYGMGPVYATMWIDRDLREQKTGKK